MTDSNPPTDPDPVTELDGTPLDHRTVRTDGIDLHAVVAGPADGDPIVLLHGFPEFWYSWRGQIPALADAGFRIVAPDLRGYGRSERPRGVAAYALEELVADVAGLIDEFGVADGDDPATASVVGHDWGGVIAWRLAIDRPGSVDRLAVLNAPHPGAFRRDALTLAQFRRSLYALFFQLPRLPERAIRRDDFAAFERLFVDGVAGEGFSEADLERYRAAFRPPGAPTAALNYYRALGRRRVPAELARTFLGRERPDETVRVPTLVLWGLDDPALGSSLSQGLSAWVPDLRVERFPEAGHWVQFDAREAVVDALVEFLA